MIIGSMSPDLGYYTRQFQLSRFAHTIVGTLTVCLPTGLLALGIFYMLRRPMCWLLPQPHRRALMPLALVRPNSEPRSLLAAAASVLLGTWTHVLWDSFTHSGEWAVERISILRTPILQIGDSVLPVSYLLQQFSTFGGGVALALVYLLWLHRQRLTVSHVPDGSSDGWRYMLLGSLAVVSLGVAAPAAIRLASSFQGYMAIRVLVFRTFVYSSGIFAMLFAVSSVVLYLLHRREMAQV